ncbi:MAG: hypothetical protein ACRC0V_07515 [Fusobacteriaceae bacterium]
MSRKLFGQTLSTIINKAKRFAYGDLTASVENITIQEYEDQLSEVFEIDKKAADIAELQHSISTDPWHVVGGSGEVPFASGWQSPYTPLAFRMFDAHTVQIIGEAIYFGGVDVIFTLPVSYRPTFLASAICIKNEASNIVTPLKLSIGTNGEVYISSLESFNCNVMFQTGNI